MSYLSYAAYKASGVEWLPEIPAHWNLLSFRRGIAFLTDFEANGSFADTKENVSLDVADPFAWYVRATDLENNRRGMVEGNRFCDKATYDYLQKTRLYGGELLIAKRGEIGKLYLMPETDIPATLAPNLYLVRLNDYLFPPFAYLWFSSNYGNPQLVLADKSTTIGALYKDDIKSCLCLFPPFEEQRAIATFLDFETNRIDVLIAKQEQMITLLHEKRKALISHAVTRGLNPDAPLKDSGLDWLGMVPNHWTVKRLKFCTKRMIAGPFGSSLTKDMYTGKGFKVYGQEQVIPNNFSIGDYYISPVQYAEMAQYAVAPGNVLISCVGSFGKVAVVPDEAEPGIINPRLVMLEPDRSQVIPQYLGFVLKSKIAADQLDQASRGGTMGVINLALLSEVIIPFPPLNEQQDVLTNTQDEIIKIDTLIDKAQIAIDLLKEHRTSLISAAVTGKIDVRNAQMGKKV